MIYTDAPSQASNQLLEQLVALKEKEVALLEENRKKENDRSLLSAVAENHFAAVEEMLNKGADPNCINQYAIKNFPQGWTPLHYAVQLFSLKIFNCLLANKADPNLANYEGDTPLHFACRTKNITILKTLLKNGADPNLKNKQDQTPLHRLIINSIRYLEKTDLYAALTSNPNTEINAQDAGGNTPLHYACKNLYSNFIQPLLEKGGNPAIKNALGETPFDLFCHNLSRDDLSSERQALYNLKLLLESGIDMNAQDINGDTLLHKNLNHHFIKFLLDTSAWQDILNKKGLPPLFQQFEHPWKNLISLRIIQIFITHQTDDIRDREGNNLFHFLSKKNLDNKRECLNLIRQNRVIDINAKNMIGNTPLHEACLNKNAILARFLITEKADLHITNNEGKTAWDVANESGGQKLVACFQEKPNCIIS